MCDWAAPDSAGNIPAVLQSDETGARATAASCCYGSEFSILIFDDISNQHARELISARKTPHTNTTITKA